MNNIYDIRIDNAENGTNFIDGNILFTTDSNGKIVLSSDNIKEGYNNPFYSDTKVSNNPDVIKGCDAYMWGNHNTSGYVYTSDYKTWDIIYINSASFIAEPYKYYIVDATTTGMVTMILPIFANNSVDEFYVKLEKNTHKINVTDGINSWLIPNLSGSLHIKGNGQDKYEIINDNRGMWTSVDITESRDYSDGDGFEHQYTYYIRPQSSSDNIVLTLPAPKTYDHNKSIRATFILKDQGSYTILRADGGYINGEVQITNTSINSSITIEENNGLYNIVEDTRSNSEPVLSTPFYRLNETSGIGNYYLLTNTKNDPFYSPTGFELVTPPITTTTAINYVSYICNCNSIVGTLEASRIVFTVDTRLTLEPDANDPRVYAYYEIYKRTALGVETLLSTSSSFIISSHIYSQYKTEMDMPETIFELSDSIVMKVWIGRTITGGVNPTLTTKIEGAFGAYFRREFSASALKHKDILGRDAESSHPISAITNLQTVLTDINDRLSFTDTVNVSTPDENDYLVYDGSTWINKQLIYNDYTTAGMLTDNSFNTLENKTISYENNNLILDTESVFYSTTSGHLNTLQDLVNHMWSIGVCGNTFNLTFGTNGYVEISEGECNLRNENTAHAELHNYVISSSTGLVLDNNITNFIIADYNNGNPIITYTTDLNDVLDDNTKALVWIVNRLDDEYSYIDFRGNTVDFIVKYSKKRYQVSGIEHGSGTIITDIGNRNFAITEGNFWLLNQNVKHDSFNTSTSDTFEYLYRNGSGGWTRTLGNTQINNQYYDNGTGILTELSTNNFGVHYVYMSFGNPNRLKIVYGRSSYNTIANAQASVIPTDLPSDLGSLSVSEFIGKIIIQKGGTAFVDIQSPFISQLVSSSVLSHNNLSGIQGGNINEYYHLSQTLYNNLQNYSATTSNLYTQINDKISLSDYGNIMNDPTGFENTTDSTISMVDGTRTFQITPTTVSYNFYIKGVKYTKSSIITKVISDTEGLHYLYFDNTGTIQATTTYSTNLIIDYALISIIYWDVTNQKSIVFEERHGYLMPSNLHVYLHIYERARYKSGMQLADFTIGNGDLDIHAQYSIGTGVFSDEDIQITVSGVTLAGADKTIYYRLANNNIRWASNSTFPVITTGTGRLAYNPSGSALVEVSNNNYVLYHVVALNNGKYAFMVGQNEYSNIANAREGAKTEAASLQYGGLDTITPEFVVVASVIYQTSTGYDNSVKARIVEVDTGINYVDWRNITISGVSGVNTSNHNLLTNLQGGDIEQYYHLSQTLYEDLQNYSATTAGFYTKLNNYHCIQYHLSESVSNTTVYFYSGSVETDASNRIRSGNDSGFTFGSSCSPILCPCDGTIVKAGVVVYGAGVQNGTVVYPVTLKTELNKILFNSSTSSGAINFSISSDYTVGTYSPANTTFKGTNDSLNIAVNRNDLLALKFINGTGASEVGQINNVMINLIIKEN